MIQVDELTQKRVNNFIEECLQETMHNNKGEVRNFAAGVYHGVQRTLHMLGVEIDDKGKVKKEVEK